MTGNVGGGQWSGESERAASVRAAGLPRRGNLVLLLPAQPLLTVSSSVPPPDNTRPLTATSGLTSGESRELLEEVSDSIPALISYLSVDGRYRFANRAYLDWFGVTPAEIIGRPVVEVVGESMWNASLPRFQEALAGHRVDYEVEAHYRYGTRRWVHVTYTPHRSPDGSVAGVVAMVSDITARKTAEEAARAANERMQLAISMAKAGTWDYDMVAGKLYWSDSHFRLLGLEPTPSREATMDMWQSRLPPEDLARFMAERQRAEREHGTLDTVYRIRRANGQFMWARATGRFLYDDAGKPVRFVGVFYDINESKETEQRLEKLVDERTAALRVKLSELEAFSYSLSHDLRGPLRSMYGFAKVLLTDYAPKLDDDARDYLRRIERGAQRLDQLVRDVLAYSQVAKDKYERMPIDLSVVVADVVHTLGNAKARFDIESPLPTVLGHGALLQQIFSNLLDNAVKFVRGGETAVVRVYARREGQFVRIFVEDEGIGVAPQHIERIFEIFGRVHAEGEYPGTGIGLAIVSKAAERLGGRVGVESNGTRGARFWVDLLPA